MRIPALTASFNQEFNTTKTESQIRAAVKNHDIKCGRTGFTKGEKLHKWKTEQVAWVREAYTRLSLVEMTAEFNRVFNDDKRVSQMRSLTRNQHIKSGRTGHMNAGNEPWNKGTKGLTGANSGSFKKGDIPGNQRSLGDERICTKDGYILIKIDEEKPYTGAPTRFKAKHVWLWEQAHGPVPEKHTVSFIDGDKSNCVLENLELLSRSALLYLNQSGIKDLPDALKPTMRTVAKLQAAAGAKAKDLA